MPVKYPDAQSWGSVKRSSDGLRWSAYPDGNSPTGYVTQFPLTENPISEGGRWQFNALQPIQTPVRTETLAGVHVAHGTQDGHSAPPYDDSTTWLTGFGNDYEIEAIVWLASSQTSGSGIYKEFEILLRWSDANAQISTAYGSTTIRGYEISCAWDGAYGNVGRYKGSNLATWTPGAAPATGDKFRARIQGQRIQVWWNNVSKVDYTDSDGANNVTAGAPGIGFWANGCPSNEIGFSKVTVTPL